MKRSENKDRNQRKASKFRFNVIDVLVIVLMIACVVGLVLRFTILDNIGTSSSLKEYYITFTAGSLTTAQAELLTKAVDGADVGENWVYLDDGQTKLGFLTSINGQNKESLEFNVNGESIIVDYPESETDVPWSITGKIVCSGVYSETTGFLLNGTKYIGPNSDITVRTAYCDFTLKVISVLEAVG